MSGSGIEELYELEKLGVPRTHVECLIWFRENEGKIVDNDTIKGKRVDGTNSAGNRLQRRRPIPANEIVKGLHYIHGGGVRGSYKPGGAKLVGYDQNKNPPQIWQGEDNFVQAIQTGDDGTLEGYDKEIEFDGNGNWTKINYNHLPDRRYYEITGGHLQRCYDNKVPVGVIYKQADGQKKIIGLGLITKVSTNKLDYTIEPYKMSKQSTFKFVRKDFRCKKEKNDAQYRRGRFVELFDDMIPKLGPHFDEVKKDVGLSVESPKRKFSYFGRHVKRGGGTYFDYTWLGIWIAPPTANPTSSKSDFVFSARDTVQFQVGINPREPLWAGLYIGRLPGVENTRKRMLTLLKDQSKECLRRFKALPEGYVIMIYGSKTKDETTGSRLRGNWETSKLDEDSLNEILEKYSEKGSDFRICKLFTKEEALSY